MTLKAGSKFALMAEGPLVPHSRALAGLEMIAATTSKMGGRPKLHARILPAIRTILAVPETLIMRTFLNGHPLTSRLFETTDRSRSTRAVAIILPG
jgi:hypothetical protein